VTGKPDRMDGSEVEEYHKEGKIKEIGDYCESDVVVNTYRLWPAILILTDCYGGCDGG
jgi:hypothetical protein